METEGAPVPTNGRIRQGLRSEPSLEGGLRPGRGCAGDGGIARVLIEYLCRVKGAGAANWGGLVGTTPGVVPRAVAGGGRVPWARSVSLTRGL